MFKISTSKCTFFYYFNWCFIWAKIYIYTTPLSYVTEFFNLFKPSFLLTPINKHIKVVSFALNIAIFFKACAHYFLPNFYFFIKWLAFKNYEKCFLFHIKSSFHSRDIQIFVIFSLPFHTFQTQKGKWKWNNLWRHKLVCINLQM